MKSLKEIVKDSYSFVKRNVGCFIAVGALATGVYFLPKIIPRSSSSENPVSFDTALEDVSKGGKREYHTGIYNNQLLDYFHKFNDKNYDVSIFIRPRKGNFSDIMDIDIEFKEKNELSKIIKGYILTFHKKEDGTVLYIGRSIDEKGEESKEYISNEEFKLAYQKFLNIHESYLKNK